MHVKRALIEQGRIFSDPLAMRILGEDSETVIRERTRYALVKVVNVISRGQRIFLRMTEEVV